jgi:uncharacterized protein (DUF736 family)
MNTIGTFKQDGERYTGTINTLKYRGPATIEPIAEKKTANAPDFQFLAGGQRTEMGAARKKVSESGTEYLSVRLDEPSFPAPVFCRLVRFEGEEVHRLIWSRN